MGTSCWLRSLRRCAATPSNKCVNAAYSPPATTKEPKDLRLSPLNLLLAIAQGPCFVFSLSHRTPRNAGAISLTIAHYLTPICRRRCHHRHHVFMQTACEGKEDGGEWGYMHNTRMLGGLYNIRQCNEGAVCCISAHHPLHAIIFPRPRLHEDMMTMVAAGGDQIASAEG
ncbi:unnamed protein product [Boreogadus saida]